MAIVNTALFEAGLKTDFFEAYAAAAALWPRFTLVIPSTLPSEKFRWLGAVPRMRTWAGGRQAQGLRTEAYDVESEDYENSIEVKANDLDDDQTGQTRMRIQELGEAAGTHKDYLRAQLLENGGVAGYVGYDGVTFFNTSHVSGDSGAQDNALTGAAATDTSPTTAEFKAAFAACLAKLSGYKNDKGDPINASRNGVVCEVPPCYEFVAREALGAAMIASTTNVIAGLGEVLVNPWLTSTDRFYVSVTGGRRKPFMLLDRRPLPFRSVAENDPEAAFNRRYKYGVDARYRMAFMEPLSCVRYVFT